MMFNLVAKTRGETCALAFLSFLLFSMAPSARATQSVTLAWDPSPGSDIAGYNIYYGVVSSSYTSKVSVGNVTNATVTGLVEGVTYYFAATALNTSGLESDPSNEVVYSVPAAPPGTTNQPPTLNIIPNVAINENAPEQTVNLSGISSGLANEVQTLTVTASSSNPGLIPNPTVIYTSPNTTGTLKFTPLNYAYGTATITVQVNDGQPTNNIVTRTFAVTVAPVNQPPTLNTISAVSINENASEQTVIFSGIGSGAPNETQPLSVTASSSNPALIANPAVFYTSPDTTGILKFTPVSYAYGTATITVQVNDGQASNNIVTRTFAVTVAPVNQAPTLNTLSAVSINENAPEQSVTLSGITSGSASEVQALTVTASSSNPGLIPNPTVFYTSPNSMGTLRFTPVTYGNGSATITVQVNDGQPSNNIVTRTFAVTVAPMNQPPTLNAISAVSINENATEQTVTLSGIGSGAPNESQPLSITASSSNPALIANPAIIYTSPNTTGTLRFTPLAYAYGTATITVQVNDGQPTNNITTRTFAVTVAPVNQPPTLNGISAVSINENAPEQTVALSGITTGAPNENQTLTLTASSSNPALIPSPTVLYTSPAATGTLRFTPVMYADGTATVTVQVNDGQASNNIVVRTFVVTVAPVNQAPTLNPIADLSINQNSPEQIVALSGISSGAINETQTLTVTASSSNPALISNPTIIYASPNPVGTLKFTPVAGAYGNATLTVQVNDGGSANNTVTRTFTVAVVPVNRPPTLNAIADVSLEENALAQTVTLSGISSGASDEVQNLTVTAFSSDPGLIPNPTVSYLSPNTTGTLTFAPVTYGYGTAMITVQVNDGQSTGNLVTRTFVVTVAPVNQAPTLAPIPDFMLPVSVPSQTVTLTGISSGGTNESQSLLVSAISSNPGLIPNPPVAYVSPNATAGLTLTPMNKATGTAIITVTVSDGQPVNSSVSRSFTVTMVDGNQPPTLDPLPNLVLQKSSSVQRVNLTGITSGAPFETQPLSVTAISSDTALIPNPTVSYLSPNTTGSITFRPAASRTGTATITLTVNDGQLTISRAFTVNVVDVLAPQITKAPTQQTVIGPGPFTLSAETTGASPRYQWYKDGAAIPGATALSLTVTNSSRAHSGLYSITVSNSVGLVSSPNADVRVMMPQNVSGPEVQPDGSIVITSADFDGGVLSSDDIAHFELQASDDFNSWVPVASSALLTNGFLVFRDSTPAIAPVRYYRVVENP